MDRNHPAWHGHFAHISSFHMFPCHCAETSLLKFLVDSTAPKKCPPVWRNALLHKRWYSNKLCYRSWRHMSLEIMCSPSDMAGMFFSDQWHFFGRRQTKTAILLVVYPIKAPQTSPISGAPRWVIGLIPSWLIYPAIKQSGKSLMIFPRKHPIILDFPICSYMFLCSQ